MLIDSNILIYAINSSSPKHKIAQTFLQENIGELVLAQQNIFETLRILTHSKFPSPLTVREAILQVKSIIDVSRVIAPDYKTHYLALELIKKYNLASYLVFDAYLAATVLSNGITTIATDNVKDFQKFEITVVNPFVKGE
ncbi:MAG TPA: PIN domain-containing protein [Methylomirabilota bacterium]|nr:PIN domain-containing protein [Methylomirabilota bacterium]